mmetsp:Transcript_91081/g.178245  ORF Transcript_91081/g.178245 Transcript_91081/m.178245 type:complete len:711 (+) Transcript_91081:245-2377(+)
MRLRYSKATAALLLVATTSTTNGLSSSDASSAGRTGRELRGKPSPNGRLASTTTVPSDTNERTRRRKRKVGTAPLVDSTLLRFVSEQKKRQEAQLVRQPELPSGRTSIESLVNMQLLEQQTTSSLPAAESNRTVFLDGEAILDSMAASLRGQDHMDPWMGQYNRNRVAQKLMSLGVDADNAMEAGEKIQSYLLTRTARRRIRIFLKERDSLWNKSDEELATLQLQQLVESKVSRMTSIQPGFGFDDVVDVMLEFGLTGNDVCTILTHTPNIAIMMPRKSFVERSRKCAMESDDNNSIGWSVTDTLEDTLDRSFNQLLQNDLGLRKYDARKVLRSCPGLLSVRGSQSAVQIVAMMTKLGVSKNSIARDKTALPLLLSRSPAAMFRLVSFLCSDKVRMPIKSIGPLLRRPASRELVDKLAPVPKLQQTPQLDDDEAIGPYEESALWGRHREERFKNINDLYRNMTATAQALRFQVGAKDLGKLISAYPSVLLLSAEEQILPTASYLVEELGIWKDGLPGVLQQYPMLLGKDIEEMKKVTSFLRFLGVKEEDLGRMFRAFPGLLTMDIEKEMTPVVDFLIEIGVSNIGAFVTTLPPVLGYSVEKELRPKWEYLQRVCLQPTFEINNFPGYFSYPFDRVIRTRYDYLAVKGIARQLVPVDAVVRFGDIDFATKIARDNDGGQVFRAFCEKRKLTVTGQQRRPRQNKANHPNTPQ